MCRELAQLLSRATNKSAFFLFNTQMGDIDKSTGVAVGKLHDQIHSISVNLRSFSACFIHSGAADMKFRELRDGTRKDAMVVLEEVLPLSNNLITSVSNVFDCYEGLEFEEWCNEIPSILEKTIAYRQLSEKLLQRCEAALVPLKK